MNKKEYLRYHEYLKTKSIIGTLYRYYYVYPILKKYIKGVLLDYGCGLGDLLSKYTNSIGVDVNPYNVDYCFKKGLSAFLLKDYISKKIKFDTIILDNVIEHVSNPKEIVNNICNFSKSETILIVGVPGLKGYASDPDHKIYYNRDNLVPLFSKNGYIFQDFFFTPWKSELLSKYSKRYCQYFIFHYK